MKKSIKKSILNKTTISNLDLSIRIIKTLVLIPVIMLSSCKKEPGYPPNSPSGERKASTSIQGTNENQAKLFSASSNTACGIPINKFSPGDNNYYSFALKTADDFKPYHINDDGYVSFSTVDKFSFEFTGYADPAQTIRIWYIKRNDGKYLTNYNRSAKFMIKDIGSYSIAQRFILSPLGNNWYKLVNQIQNSCSLASLNPDIDNDGTYKLSFAPSDIQPERIVYMFVNGSILTTPPLTK